MQNTNLATALFTMLLVASGCGDTGPETSAGQTNTSASSVREEVLQSAATKDEGYFNINITGDVEVVLESRVI